MSRPGNTVSPLITWRLRLVLMQRFYFSGVKLWYVCLVLFVVGISTLIFSHDAEGQANCEVTRPPIMNHMIGHWSVAWKYRVAVGEYANSIATSVINSALAGCVLSKDFNGELLGEPFARFSLISIEKDGSLKEIHIDSQHRSFNETVGRVTSDSLIFDWARDMGDRVMRRRMYYVSSGPDQFTSRAYLSISEVSPSELVEESTYTRVADN